ncbi:MAG: hypothetical protein M3N97_16310 [Pseudomonadota bacterium]|nr:hypothetical protein [Pseudomonadota bacterium]
MKATVRGLVGLFIDDGSLVVAIIAWLVLTWRIARSPLIPPLWVGPILFTGLAAILAENVHRWSRRHRTARRASRPS